MDRESALFYVVLFLFACTGVVTILGIIQKVTIEKKYLNGLFSALILELITAVLFMFSNTNFFVPQINENDILISRSTISEAYKNITKTDLLIMLRKHEGCKEKVSGLEDKLKLLQNSFSSQIPPYEGVTLTLNEKLKEISELKQSNESAKEYERKYIKLEKHFLVRMATLNAMLSEWGTSINLRWRPEEKRVISKMLQEAFKQIGFMDQNEVPDDDPEKTHRLLVAYQKQKKFGETGFLTSEVIAFIIRDYLS